MLQLSLPLPEDNPDAMMVILGILHHGFHKVIKTVPFRTVVHISILVDKYMMLDALKPFLDSWLSDRSVGPDWLGLAYNLEDIYPWLCIAYVAKSQHAFKLLTRCMMRDRSSQTILPVYEGGDLPIPQTVIGK